MNQIEILWRTTYKGLRPRPIKLQIPGWAGHDLNHGDGATPQPWHCPPFVDGSTYGLELLYPFDAECSVSIRNGVLHFDVDFAEEIHPSMKGPPFKEFAPNHYGFTSSLDLLVPDDMVVRVEAHARFFTDTSGTCPCAVPGHIHTAFWPRIFFVVFKAPWPGQIHVFRKGDPYAQVLVLPRKTRYDTKPMGEEQAKARESMSAIMNEGGEEIAKHGWVDNKGNYFNDKYKVLQSAFLKRGHQGVKDVLAEAIKAWLPKQSLARKQPILKETRSEGKSAG
jgi:hypothetical protein